MDEKKYNEKLNELESQLARHERELKKPAKADNEDNTLEQLDILIDSITSNKKRLSNYGKPFYYISILHL